MQFQEINFDGLLGPTHNYAGLSLGNQASWDNRGSESKPREGALQGLEKMKGLADRGFLQGIFPPQERPSILHLRHWGITGNSDSDILAKAARDHPALLAAAASASSMWTANACTMTPSIDSKDERAQFTPANLSSKLHRSIEASFTETMLRRIFADEERYAVHPPVFGGISMADEGAANHTRLCEDASGKGLHCFVHGCSSMDTTLPQPVKFPARQTRESFEAIARIHGIPESQQIHLQQSPVAIDAGVFHNDVIAVGCRNTYFCHEDAYVHQQDSLKSLNEAYSRLTGKELQLIQVGRDQLSLAEAVHSYLFNSQLLPLDSGKLLLVAPGECAEMENVASLLRGFVEDSDNPIGEVLTFNLRESMRNGGGPACLRQRVVLNNNEIRHIQGRVLLDEALYTDLKAWIETHYREELSPMDLADPKLLQESREALDALSQLLHLPTLYSFQK